MKYRFIPLLSLLATPALATESGTEFAPLRVEHRKETLYIVAASRRDASHGGVALAWLPPAAIPVCMGKTLKDCENDDHSRRIIEYTDPDGTARIGFRDLPHEDPNRVLTEWVTSEMPYNKSNPSLLPQLWALPVVSHALVSRNATGSNEMKIEPISEQNTIKANITYTVWPNGEGFRIDSLIP